MGCISSIFRCGYHVKIDEDGGYRQDAFVSSLLLFFAFIALPLSFCTLFYMDLPQTMKIEKEDVYYLLCACMGLGMLVMILMMGTRTCKSWVIPAEQVRRLEAEERGDAQEDAPEEGSRINHYFQNHVTIIGMGVFYSFGLVDDVSNVIGGFMCYQTMNSCGDPPLFNKFLKENLPFTVFSLVRPLFLGTMFIFCIRFHGKRLKKCAKVRYCLVAVLLAAAAVWVHANLREVNEHQDNKRNGGRPRHHGHHKPLSPNKDNLDISVGQNLPFSDCNEIIDDPATSNNTIFMCEGRRGPIYDFVKAIFPFIYPLHIEMTLLVIELLAHLTSLLSIADDEEDPQIQVVINDYPKPDERNPLLRFRGDLRQQVQVRPPQRRGGCFNVLYCLTLILVAIINAVHILLSYFTRNDDDNSPTPDQFRYMYNVEQIIYFSAVFLMTLLAFALSCNFQTVYRDTKQHRYDGIELMFLLSSLGLFFLSAISVVVSYFCYLGTHYVQKDDIPDNCVSPLMHGSHFEPPPKPTERNSLTWLIIYVIDGVTIYPLTALVLHAGRVKPRPGQSRLRIEAFRLCLLVLSLCNLTIWFAFGFLEGSNPDITPGKNYYFYEKGPELSSWDNIHYSLSPINLFYRFTAAILLLKIYLK